MFVMLCPKYTFIVNTSLNVLQLNYQYLKGCVESAPIAPMQQQWVDRIVAMIPMQLMEKTNLKDVLEGVFSEVQNGFNDSMKMSMGICQVSFFVS